jgi:hypothetical protein
MIYHQQNQRKKQGRKEKIQKQMERVKVR